MYKLFLCLRYLKRRYLALIAVLAVWLCVFMVLVAVSVMDGFLKKVESAAKGLFGDIIVDATSLSGIGRYDEFIGELTGEYRVNADFQPEEVKHKGDTAEVVYRAKAAWIDIETLAGKLEFDRRITRPARTALFKNGRFHRELRGRLVLEPDRTLRFTAGGLSPAEAADKSLRPGAVYARVGEGISEIESATPVIYSYGLLRIGPSYTATVQICGIRLPERLATTNFEDGLFVQTGQSDAGFDPPLELLLKRTQKHLELIESALEREEARPAPKQDKTLIGRLADARTHALAKLQLLADSLLRQQLVGEIEGRLGAEAAKPPPRRDEEEIRRLTEEIAGHRDELHDRFRSPGFRVILGLGIAGLSFRTPAGETIRAITPGQKTILTLLPVGRGVSITVTPNTRTFVAVDDVQTDVYPIDSKTVYVPFDTLAALADMDERRDMDDPANVEPACCSQIQIKVRPGYTSGAKLVAVRSKVREAWRRFLEVRRDAASTNVIVHTWREKLESFVGPIQKQRTLVTMMFGIISSVSVLLIFAIFYMIVMQKIRDIGVIRAVGGSSAGVAQMFLAYGAATGLVGSILGLTCGYLFVHYINPIQDFIDRAFGYRVWDRDVFLFDEIPNEVDPALMVTIAAWAIVSGLIGALIPAVRAAMMEPAEAVRYE